MADLSTLRGRLHSYAWPGSLAVQPLGFVQGHGRAPTLILIRDIHGVERSIPHDVLYRRGFENVILNDLFGGREWHLRQWWPIDPRCPENSGTWDHKWARDALLLGVSGTGALPQIMEKHAC